MGAKSWVWKSLVAGFCGMLVHFAFMYIKTRAGLLPSFQPYERLQSFLSELVGTDVPAIVPWALSLVNGMAILGSCLAAFSACCPVEMAQERHDVRPCGMGADGPDFLSSDRAGSVCRESGAGDRTGGDVIVMLMTYSVVVGAVYMALDGLNFEI